MYSIHILCLTMTALTFWNYTPQVGGNELVYGGYKFLIRQDPIRAYWRDDKTKSTEGGKGRPDFDLVNSSNWNGYETSWEIRKSRLWLNGIKGRIKGKDISNERILSGQRFPCEADWFSGRIYVPVGDYDELTDKHESVIEFEIDRGHVKDISFHRLLKINDYWNGIEEKK